MPQHELSPEFSSCLKRLEVSDWEDAEKAFPAAEVVVSDGSIILLARCIKYIDLYFFTIKHHFLPVRIGFGRFVVLHKLSHQTCTDSTATVGTGQQLKLSTNTSYKGTLSRFYVDTRLFRCLFTPTCFFVFCILLLFCAAHVANKDTYYLPSHVNSTKKINTAKAVEL